LTRRPKPLPSPLREDGGGGGGAGAGACPAGCKPRAAEAKADERSASIAAQLKLFAGPQLEKIEAEKSTLLESEDQIVKGLAALETAKADVEEKRAEAATVRAQRGAKIGAATKEILKLHQLGGRSAMILERLRTDAKVRADRVLAATAGPKEALASRRRELAELRDSEAGKKAQGMQDLVRDPPLVSVLFGSDPGCLRLPGRDHPRARG